MKPGNNNYNQQQRSLEDRVLRFLESTPEAESIDKLPLTEAQRESEKADFFLSGRQVVCEVKSLQTDTKEKINKLLQPIMESNDAPVFYGTWQLSNVLKNIQNGERIKHEIFDAVTSAIQTLFRKANRQIRTTKQMFGVSSAGGALVIANDLVEVLSPEVIRHKIRELFQKRTPKGDLQFSEIEVVWVLCETHFIEVNPGMKGLPAMLLARGGQSPTMAVIEGLQPAWAAAHGVPIIEMDSALFDTARFKSQNSADSPPNGPMSRHMLWRHHYRQQPYLRSLSESKLGEYYQELMTALTPGLLKGASIKEKKRSTDLMERFTHFLEEINERGIDLKKYAPLMQALGEGFKAANPPVPNVAKVEEFANTKVRLEPRKFFTNASKEDFRCLKVENGTATLLFLGILMGKSLEIVFSVNEANWQHYWPITDVGLLTALERRFERFISKHPEWR